MSLLASIQAKKRTLRPAETLITCLDGRKFIENENSTLTEVEGKQYGFVIDTKPDDVPAKITENIYLGSQDCCDPEILKKHGITNVLSVGIEAPMKDPDVNYKYVDCLDLPETDLDRCLRECVPFMNGVTEQCGKVLVHCNAGVSRSATVVIGYLMLVKDYNYLDAYKIVKSVRSCIKPNPGFEKQLQRLNVDELSKFS